MSHEQTILENLKFTTMNIYEILMPIAVIGTFSFGVYLFTKTISDYNLRKKMVDKGYVNEENKHLLAKQNDDNKYSSLKWGLLVLSAGIGLVIIDYLPRKHDSVLPFGIFAICVSLGFLVYFLIAKNLTKND